MSAILPRSRVSQEQMDALLTFMEEHPEFAAGKQSLYSRFSSSKLWRLLAERLNAAAAESGGARKSPDKWCRFWADIKYKTRKKTAAGGTLGELSHIEERLAAVIGAREEERTRQPDEQGSGSEAGDSRLSTEELLAEAAMRSALAAEKQAEAVAQAVDLLRELVSVLRRDPPNAAPPPSTVLHPEQHLPHQMHHHRL